MGKNSGIVLKKRINQLVVLDSQMGKVGFVSTNENICVGALICYQRVPRKHLLISDIETVIVPIGLAQDDILFLHHVLEVSFYFLSNESPAPEVFYLIQFLYTYKMRPLPLLFKKVFMAKLLLVCGEYQEDKVFHATYFQMLISESVDIIVNRGLNLEFERCLDEWLLKCISRHPKIEQFKTVYFLAESRIA